MRILTLAILIIVTTSTWPLAAQESPRALTGLVGSDFAATTVRPLLPAEQTAPASKSVLVAGGLSAVLPGSGQLYAEAPVWRAVMYAGLEAIGWTAYAVTSARGDELTDEFETFANEHWSVVRYVEWLAANYARWPDSAVNKQAAAEALAVIYRSGDPSRPEHERVDFVQLNKLERAVRGGFSHTLPHFGHQQYYEQIGKYVQYRAGWDDHAGRVDTVIYDPSRVTGRNDLYMAKRADANDYLGYASAAIGGIILNHVASLLDAVLAARGFNAAVQAELKGSIVPDAAEPLQASLSLSVRF